MFPQLCLLAKCFKPALPYLDVDMVDICKENGAYEAKHFLCYYYYGGMVYTGLKNFERALYFYEQVVGAPPGAYELAGWRLELQGRVLSEAVSLWPGAQGRGGMGTVGQADQALPRPPSGLG